MADETAKIAAPPCHWQQVIESNRSVDEAVSAIEHAVWGAHPEPKAAAPDPMPPSAAFKLAPKQAVWPIAPVAELRRLDVPAPAAPPPPSPSRAVPPLTLVGMATAKPAAAPAEPAAFRERDLDAIAAQLASQLDELKRQRESMVDPATLVFTIPWSTTPRSLLVQDEASGGWHPNPVNDDEIRDVVQPHWRVLYERAQAAEAAAATADEAYRRAGPLRRIGALRRALREAREAAAEADRAKRAADLLWAGDAIRQQAAHSRQLADQSFQDAMKAASNVVQLHADIADLESQQALLAALREVGATTVVQRGDETQTQALERTLAETKSADTAEPVMPAA